MRNLQSQYLIKDFSVPSCEIFCHNSCFEVLKEPNRTKKCTLSNWENDLDSLQIEYAALDVIFMSEIFEKLFGSDTSMQKYAIGMFGQRHPSLTKNTITPQRVIPVKAEPNHVDETPVNIF